MKVPDSVVRAALVAVQTETNKARSLAEHNGDAALVDAIDAILVALFDAKKMVPR